MKTEEGKKNVVIMATELFEELLEEIKEVKNSKK